MDVQQEFKSLNIIWLALTIGPILMAGALIIPSLPLEQPEDGVFDFILPLVFFSAIGIGYLMHQRRLGTAISVKGLQEQFNHYRTGSIISLALIEGANIVTVLFTFLGGNLNNLLYLAIGLLAMLYFRPNMIKFQQEYELTPEDDAQFP